MPRPRSWGLLRLVACYAELPRIVLMRSWVNKGPGLQKSSALNVGHAAFASLCLGGPPCHGSVTYWSRNALASGVSSR